MPKRTDELDKILSISIANLKDTYVILDSDDLERSGKTRFEDFLDHIANQFVFRGFAFSDGTGVAFTDNTLAEIQGVS